MKSHVKIAYMIYRTLKIDRAMQLQKYLNSMFRSKCASSILYSLIF